jgi:Domain of unknown function (DUF4424)
MISKQNGLPEGASCRQAAAAGVLVAAFAALASPSATASDMMSELPTGGLIFTTSADIETRAEDLYISPRQIRVTYRFHNASPAEVKTLIAFPMPDIRVADAAASLPLPTSDPQNLLGFSARVDGAPVKPKVVQKVFARGTDRTADLDRLKVPMAPHLRSTDQALSRLSPSARDEMRSLGLADVEEYSVGRGMRKQLSPRWTLRTTYYWEQTFPAGKEVAVEHSYKPSVGVSSQTLLGEPEAMKEDRLRAYVSKYCIDEDFLAAVERARQAAKMQHGAPFSERRITYLLATEANRARPIGEFRLVVDKGDPANLVSFCGDGVRKIGNSRLEVRKVDFRPTADLHVLILEPLRRTGSDPSRRPSR